MCFGNQKQQTQTSSSTQTMPSWLTDAAQSNLSTAQGLNAKGFTPYGGNQVAGFSGQQQGSFGLGDSIAGAVTPQLQLAGTGYENYINRGPQQVSAPTIASQMSPYMNQYVMQALAPQLQQQDLQFANQNKAVDSAATMAGAFGDTGWGQLRGTTTQAQDAARSGLIGNAYNAAFNTAIGAGAQDVANNVNAQNANAGWQEQYLNRQLGGANALMGAGANAAQIQNMLGGQQTAADQARLNAQYNQWLMAQQYPFQTLQAMNQTLGASRAGAPVTTNGTSTTSAPDNSGWGMVGSALGTIGGAMLGGPVGAGISGSLGSSFGSGLGNMFGGNVAANWGANPGVPGGGYIGTGGQVYQGPGGYADGGAIPGGKPAVVGERGPELFIPNVPGVVIPNEIMEAAREKRAKKVGKPVDSLARQLGIAA